MRWNQGRAEIEQMLTPPDRRQPSAFAAPTPKKRQPLAV